MPRNMFEEYDSQGERVSPAPPKSKEGDEICVRALVYAVVQLYIPEVDNERDAKAEIAAVLADSDSVMLSPEHHSASDYQVIWVEVEDPGGQDVPG